MANVPASVGYFTLDGTFAIGFADSTDGDAFPDSVLANGTVVATPLHGNDPLVVLSPKMLLSTYPVTCTLVGGRVYGPDNGQSGTATVGTPGVRLIAPRQATIVPQNWAWQFDFTPADGESWAPFSRQISPEPDTTIDIADLVLLEPPISAPMFQINVFSVAFDLEDWIPDVGYTPPPGFRPGIDWLYSTTDGFYGSLEES